MVNSIFVKDTNIRNSYWGGAWCDIECGRFEVHGSVLTGNGALETANRHMNFPIVASKDLEAYSSSFVSTSAMGWT